MARDGDRDVVQARHRVVKRRGLTVLSLLLLLLVLVISSASADDLASQSSYLPDVIPPPNPSTTNALDTPKTDPAAAGELPHTELDRPEAAELLSSVFGTELHEAAGIFDELNVEELYSSNVAVIGQPIDGEEPSGEDSEPALLESSIPLAVESDSGDLEAVDLSLEHDDGDLRPTEPLVGVEIPSNLEEGIFLPGVNVSVELANAPEGRAPSVVEEGTAFFPNVAPDTDLAVAPTPDGMETLTQLRSPEAPQTETFDLSLPATAELHSTSVGGAEVSEGAKPLLVIPPPTALDANGQEVPVSLDVSGDALAIHADPSPETRYPVLVDPLYEQPYVWMWNHSFTGMSDWRHEMNAGASSVPYEFNFSQEGYVSGVGFFPGLTITTGAGTAPQWSQAKWFYAVPRYWSDVQATGEKPTSFIRTFTLHRLWYKVDEGLLHPITPDPLFRFGLWNVGSEQWTAEGHRYGTEGNLTNLDTTYNAPNPSEQVGAKIALLMMESGTETQLQYRELLAGEASIELSDKDAPAISHTKTTISGWANTTPVSPLTITASDTGLGVKEIVVKQPEGATVAAKSSCTGIASNPCPRTWDSASPGTPVVNYEPKTMPQGVDMLQLEAVDPIGHRSPEEGHGPSYVQVNVDHTPPSLSISGSATEQTKLGTKLPQYTLKYSASDGDGAAASALSPFGSAGTGEGKFERPQGDAVDGEGNVWVVDKTNNRVEKFDSGGKFLMQFGTTGSGNGQMSDPRDIAIAPNGTLWISEAGNHRLQQFTATGQFVRTITYSGLNTPWGVATDSSGNVWVADALAHKVYEFSESGTFIRSAGHGNGPGQTLSEPGGIDVDSQGNVWVTDTAANAIFKFDSAGNFLLNFGTKGSGNGQLSAPYGIAVAPSGNLLVVDATNNRVQEFQPTGTYLRQFGSTGSGTGQLSEPRGIAVGSDGSAYVVDAGNHRVARWSHADLNPQSGVAKTEIKVDGQLVESFAPGCTTENCSIGPREKTLKANEFSSGQHTVKVIATDAVGLSTTKEFTITTDKTPPTLTATNAFFTAPDGWVEQKGYYYSPKATDAGGFGVTSLVLKIDGKVVKNAEQSCSNGGCSEEPTGVVLMSEYKGGAHSAELIATDGAGNTATKAWTINVDPKGKVSVPEAEDTLEAVEETSPANILGEAEEEPEYPGTGPGLGMQKVGSDLQSTGVVVPSTTDSSPEEGIQIEIPQKGEGACSYGPTQEEEVTSEGSEPDSELEDPEPEGAKEPLEPCKELSEPVEPTGENELLPLTEAQISPLASSSESTAVTLVGEAAGLAANTLTNVDTVIRPLYDGSMIFQAIRGPDGPESFSWEVQLEPDQKLKSIDAHHAVVYFGNYFGNEYPAFGITAEPAHDATGASVPTTLQVIENNVIKLTVEHRQAAAEGRPYIYPIIAGTGWEGGFQTYEVEMPPPTPLEGEEESIEEEEEFFEAPPGESPKIAISSYGPPIADASTAPSQAASPNVPKYSRGYNFDECAFRVVGGVIQPGEGDGPPPPERLRAQASRQCHGHYENSDGQEVEIVWALSMSGTFHYKYGHWVWTNEAPDCRKWGRDQPKKIHCGIPGPNVSNERLDVVGDFKFPPGIYAPSPNAMCYRLDGVLPIRPGEPIPGEPVFHGRLHNPHLGVEPGTECPWGNFVGSAGR